MKVLVLDTGRGIGTVKVESWREHLGLKADDRLDLVSWFPPREILPLRRHLVCGPVLRLGHEPVDWAVAEASPARAATAGEVTGSQVEPGVFGASEPTTEQDADQGYVEAADGGGSAHPGLAQPPAATDSLPVYHPRRLRQAVRWRARRHVRRVGRLPSRVRKRAHQRLSQVRGLPDRAARSLLQRRGDGIAGGYVLATLGSRQVRRLFADADVVLPVDARSQKAAWLLARRYAGPDVLVTLPAARRALDARR
jgi:hypothetical protein